LVLTFLLESKSKLVSQLVLIAGLLFSAQSLAGGGDVERDPNVDMKLSLIFDTHESENLPYVTIFNRLFANVEDTSALAAAEPFISDADEFLIELNLVVSEQNREVSFAYAVDWEIAKSLESAEPPTEYLVVIPKSLLFGGYYSWGVCINSVNAISSFIQALSRDSQISDKELVRLTNKRLHIEALCRSGAIRFDTSNNNTRYDSYLNGVYHFYENQYALAQSYFNDLLVDESAVGDYQPDDWLNETVFYLTGRVSLLQGQDKWSGYIYWNGRDDTSVDDIDSNEIEKGIDIFNKYLLTYPNGRYSRSADGLIRRAYYLLGNLERYRDRLAESLRLAMLEAVASAEGGLDQQSSEIEYFYDLLKEYQLRVAEEPFYLLTVLANEVRTQPLKENSELAKFNHELGSLQAILKEYQDGEVRLRDMESLKESALFEFYLSVYARDWQRQIRHDRIIATMHKYSDAFTYSSDPDLLIAESLEEAHGVTDVFNYPYFNHDHVKYSYMRDGCHIATSETIVMSDGNKLKNTGDHNELTRVITDYYLRKGDFSQLQKLYSMYSDEELGSYSLVRTAVDAVANNVDAAKGYMNLGYFMTNKGGALRPLVEGDCYSAEETAYRYFLRPIDQLPKGSDQAKTLHFLTLCGSNKLKCNLTWPYARNTEWVCEASGDSSQEKCDWKQRKDNRDSKYWFRKLHKQYPKSKWAEKTPYYYD